MARTRHTLASAFLAYGEVESGAVNLRNAGKQPLALTLVIEGIATDGGRSPARHPGDDTSTRRGEIDPGQDPGHDRRLSCSSCRGRPCATTSRRPRIRRHGRPQSRRDLADLLPSAFEIIKPDAFNAEGGAPPPACRAASSPVGKLRSVEAGDDRLVAVCCPKGAQASLGRRRGRGAIGRAGLALDFRIALLRPRVVSSGEFLCPATFIEPLAQPAETLRSAAGRLTIARPTAMKRRLRMGERRLTGVLTALRSSACR